MILSLTRELSPSHLYLYLYLSLSLSLCRCMLCSTTVLYIGLLLRFLSAKQMKESFLCFLRCPAITHMHSLDLITMHPFSSLPSFPLPLSLLSPPSSLKLESFSLRLRANIFCHLFAWNSLQQFLFNSLSQFKRILLLKYCHLYYCFCHYGMWPMATTLLLSSCPPPS